MPTMRTRAMRKFVASDRAQRENVPRHILYLTKRKAKEPMSETKRWAKLAAVAILGASAGVLLYQLEKDKKRKNKERLAIVDAAIVRSRSYGEQKAYIIGNSLSSLAAAVWLIKDGHFPGNRITVFGEVEKKKEDGRPLVISRENSEDFLELFKQIPSAKDPENSVEEKLYANGITWRSWEEVYSEASGENENSRSFLNREDIIAVCRLLYTEEEKLDQLSIKDWFDENAHIFTTCFWQLCQTVYGFQKDSGLGEFRRSLNEICGPFLQLSWKEQSLIMDSLKKYLRCNGVLIQENSEITDLSVENGDPLTVKALYVKRKLQEEDIDRESFVFEKIMVKSADICIMENGYKDGALWKKAAPLSLGFGAPEGLSDAQRSSGGLELCPHGYTDRPLTVPVKSRNLGFTGAFSRLEKGCCLTGEYAVSSARSAADKLLRAGKWAGDRKEPKRSCFCILKRVFEIAVQERRSGTRMPRHS